MSRKRRTPTPEEMRLWRSVAKTVTPLGREPVDLTEKAEEPGESAPGPDRSPPRKNKPPVPASEVPSYSPPVSNRARPTTDIDRRTAGRVERGVIAIDGRIDLHGMTQAAAHRQLTGFLHHAQARGDRMVLVITGKGDRGGRDDFTGHSWDEVQRGVLRRMVPQWLSSAELRPFVIGYGEAARRHGGSGALYVRIRRRRG